MSCDNLTPQGLQLFSEISLNFHVFLAVKVSFGISGQWSDPHLTNQPVAFGFLGAVFTDMRRSGLYYLI